MSNYLYSVDDGSPELMHYGVLGMKWHQHRAAHYEKKSQTCEN